MTKAKALEEGIEKANGHLGLVWIDSELAHEGAVLSNSRCYCDECDGETEHDGTSVVEIKEHSYTGEWQIAQALEDAEQYRRPGRTLVLVAAKSYGETGCQYDAGEQLLRDPQVVAVIE
jgi:hypothetical protein